ncbi:TPR-like protein [Glonium stellatum]|uniref:TPR-like protein n=1 Tax=Glonium stellatum TaxID=574774 RepID=A0A8E2EQI0_9PEZI|nr:TPR-like protein [Glonium stellatum]
MAEALAVIGIVANIIQLVDFGSRVLKRLEDYQSKLGEVPEAFRHIKAELPALLDALQQTKAAIDAGSLQDKTEKALLPAVEGCGVQIGLLNDVIIKALPESGDSWTRRGKKAARSLWYDAKVEKITAVVRGYIQTLTYHAATSSTLRPLADRTLSRPAPSSTVPFRRDPHFVDREILAEIDAKSQKSASRVALVGLGGVGKSQLAVEYSYRIREKSPATWVFWVHAGTAARFEEGYRKIAERTKLPGWNQSDVDILSLVYSWLCDEANGRWVMIIDNADDLAVFSRNGNASSNAQAALLESLPQSPNGSILITSRNRKVAFRLTGSSADIINVHPMDQVHSLALLRNKLEGSDDSIKQDDAVALVEALDYMPLAITQAAAYISQRAPRATVSKYLQNLRKGDKDRAKLLDMDIGDLRRDGTASNSIIGTWQISFEHIRKERPSAARLLSLMSLFDRQGIPQSLLVGHYQEDNEANSDFGENDANPDSEDNDTKSDSEDDNDNSDFEDDLNTLMSFSLVASDVDGHRFEMHRLVQFSTRKWLELQGKLEGWKKKYVTLMYNSYPIREYENWKVCQALFPHAQAALACRPTDYRALEAWASVLYNAAWYAVGIGNYDVASEMNQSALKAREAALGAEHPTTLCNINELALIFKSRGKYDEAEAMHRQVLEAQEKVLGKEHPHTLISASNLGYVFEGQGKYNEAEAMYRQVLEAREKVLGKEHPRTLASVSNLGQVLTSQGKYNEAETMCRRGLEAQEKVLGKEHPHTLISVSNLSRVFQSQGKYDKAEAMYRQVLEAQEKVLGKEHPHTLTSVCNLGQILTSQGKYNEAETMCRRGLEAQEKVLGKEHPHTLMSASNLASTLWCQGRWKKAEGLDVQVLEARKRVLGVEHPETLKSMHNLALTLESQGRKNEALSLLENCFHLRKQVLGLNHPDTESALETLNYWGRSS